MTDSAVVDASLAIRWVFAEVHQAEAFALLTTWQRIKLTLIAPALYASEVSVAILKRRRQGAIDEHEAQAALQLVFAAVALHPCSGAIFARAFEVADQLGQWKAYDSLYLALAESEGCEFWTADERFYNATRARFPFVRWVGEF